MDKWYRNFREFRYKWEKGNTSRGITFFPRTFHRVEPFHLNSPRNYRKFHSNGKRSRGVFHLQKNSENSYSDTHCLQTTLLIFKFANRRTKESFVTATNKPLVGTLMTIGDVTVSIAIGNSGNFRLGRERSICHKSHSFASPSPSLHQKNRCLGKLFCCFLERVFVRRFPGYYRHVWL